MSIFVDQLRLKRHIAMMIAGHHLIVIMVTITVIAHPIGIHTYLVDIASSATIP